MSFGYGINRLLDLQETNFQVCDMDVKEDKIIYTIRHKEPAQYICKHCEHPHDSYHDKEWIHIQDLPLSNGLSRGKDFFQKSETFSDATFC